MATSTWWCRSAPGRTRAAVHRARSARRRLPVSLAGRCALTCHAPSTGCGRVDSIRTSKRRRASKRWPRSTSVRSGACNRRAPTPSRGIRSAVWSPSRWRAGSWRRGTRRSTDPARRLRAPPRVSTRSAAGVSHRPGLAVGCRGAPRAARERRAVSRRARRDASRRSSRSRRLSMTAWRCRREFARSNGPACRRSRPTCRPATRAGRSSCAPSIGTRAGAIPCPSGRAVLGGVTIESVAGNHLEVLEEPFVAEVAERLAPHLGAAPMER